MTKNKALLQRAKNRRGNANIHLGYNPYYEERYHSNRTRRKGKLAKAQLFFRLKENELLWAKKQYNNYSF